MDLDNTYVWVGGISTAVTSFWKLRIYLEVASKQDDRKLYETPKLLGERYPTITGKGRLYTYMIVCIYARLYAYMLYIILTTL